MEASARASGGGTEANAVPRPKRHPHLYLEHEGGTAIFLVEDTLFKVHEYFLKQNSPIFASMFTLNPGDAPVDGRSDEQPIALHDVSAADFERLLSLFYPRDVISGDLSTLEQWTSVLRLTHIYEFEAHHALAVKRLAELAPPIDRLLLSRQYDVPEWLEDAYYELCIREPSLTLEEGARLGLAEVVRIADLRQAIRVSARVHFPEHYIRGAIRQRLTG